MKKRALLVGINYAGTANELRGCINDVNNVHAFLKTQGFNDFKIILEKEATTNGIKSGLEWLVSDLEPGDIIFFHYSGHGSQLPSRVEEDGFEEIICPIDLNWRDRVITDDTLRQIFNKVPDGVNTTLFLDCCHSGTMLDQTESLDAASPTRSTSARPRKKKGSRYLPPPAGVAKKLATRSLVDWQTARDVNKNALLIATAHASQTAADAMIDGMPQGAGTAAMLKAFDEGITYRQVVESMRSYMTRNRFSQVPQLDGASLLYDKTYLGQFGVQPSQSPLPSTDSVEEVANTDQSSIQSSGSKNSTMIIIGIVILLAILFYLV